LGAVLARAVGLAEGPFALERLLVALDFPVGLRAARPDEQVPDPALFEQFAQRAVVAVGVGVVGEQPLHLDAVAGEDGEAALDEAGYRRRRLFAVVLAVGKAGVVVDERMHPLVADPHPFLGAAAVTVAGDGMSGPSETDEPLAVDVEQIAWAWPLVAARLLAWLSRRS
jgi:hypothetical protein